ncbi:ABC transporter permease [Streptobacillus moniliformis]|uniref:Binding-protein-dependent transport systems inner membrane component n=1 Tax=Streptobacillus moniliformis (strain ATCC 14647 / DSM 12112 / NCTC 10651 / 9901) TaxID=519441 RepID=D1AYN2_STRM9|nr:oligopeptide ABC transporter permease [Streptobacillus moniliformis]ACZ01408.1 binding-protein-dependent transport systems inner membrane component [Streptobacillus moniliformis DSM 12112]AVL43580.1 ABC transporter permease [Streptobacillus moniliformis]SQA13432.1 Glutathione transport system permease protein gsiC [Streptobacillus moniliformis]
MWKTVLRRVLAMIPQLFILSIIVFIVAKLMPGDPFTGLISPTTPPEAIEKLRREAGLYDPLYTQYVNWMSRAFNGNFGISYTYKLPVTRIIGERIYNTFFLSLLSVILMYSVALPLGILSGRYNESRLDKIVTIYNFVSYAIPTFILSLLMVFVFGYKLRIFPTGGSVDLGYVPGTLDYVINKLYHLILPAITYALLATTWTIRYLRSEIIDSKSLDYVKTAKAKGVPESVIYSKHIFRNSVLPIAAFLGYTITGLFGGSIFIETIFNYPGMGQLFISSISSRDYSVITTLILFYGFLSLMGSLLSDILLMIVDPRIRIE